MKKKKLVERYHQSHDTDVEYVRNPDDWVLWLTAIPILGTIMIIVYFIFRQKK